MKGRHLSVLVPVALLALAACSLYPSPTITPTIGPTPTQGPTPTPIPVVSRDETQLAEPIALIIGQQLRVTLASNRTTGFSWALAQSIDEHIVKLAGNQYVPSSGSGVGGGGHEVWTFLGADIGQVIVSMKYARPFEPNAAPAREASFTIVVRE